METKIYAFLLIILIIGLVGGYSLGSIAQQNQDPGLEEEIDAKNEQIATLQSEVQSLNNQIESKNEQITTLQTEVQNIEEQIDAKNSQISNLQTEVQSLNNQINAKNEQIATLQTEVQSLNNQISTKNQQIVALESEVNGLRVSVEVEGVVWDVAADTANITVRNTGGVNVTITSISLQETYPGAPWVPDTSPDATGWINVGENKVFVWDGSAVYDLFPATSYVIQMDYASIYDTQYLDETP
jgi:peptidoglycan hydrolase CwlO-like protein